MHKIIQGDVFDGLATLKDESVHCVITSPPYWNLRDYGVDGQIGLENTPHEYVEKLVLVFREVRRVLRNDGTVWLVLGDSYSGKGYTSGSQDGKGNEHGQKWQMKQPTPKEIGLKSKDLVCIPWRVAMALQEDGWWLRSGIPWIKRNSMPESTSDRPSCAVEYVFLLSKNDRYFYDHVAVMINHSDKSLKRYKYGLSSAQSKSDSIIKNNKKTGVFDCDIMEDFFDMRGRNRRNSDWCFESWQGLYSEEDEPLSFIVNPCGSSDAHFAAFPAKLVEPCIKAGTSEKGCCPNCGSPWERIINRKKNEKRDSEKHRRKSIARSGRTDGKTEGPSGMMDETETIGWKPTCECNAGEPIPCTVLDIFGGSGMVSKVARDLGRLSVMIELNPEYIEIMKKKLNFKDQLFDDITIENLKENKIKKSGVL